MTIESILLQISNVLNAVIPIFILLATVVFLWGIVRYITAGDDEEQTTNARQLIIYGIIALAVMVAVWGFVNIVLDFFFGNSGIPNIPGENVIDTL